MQFKTQGLIIKEQIIGESDRLVTVLTKDQGVIRAFARRAKKLNDSKRSATQLLCYSRLTIYQGRDKYIISEAFPIEVFFDLRKSVTKLALAQYFCEIAVELVPEGVESSDYLRVVLNCLHFLCKDTRDELTLKSTAEMRMLSYAGYMPNIVCCNECGVYESDRMYLMVNESNLLCENCFVRTDAPYRVMGKSALKAMRHILYSDFEKLYSFSVSKSAQKELAAASEAYLLSIIQRRPQTLDFYNSVL